MGPKLYLAQGNVLSYFVQPTVQIFILQLSKREKSWKLHLKIWNDRLQSACKLTKTIIKTAEYISVGQVVD